MSLNFGHSFGSKMDRIKPEKVPRQRVQKLWRNVRWAEAFPDDSLTMDAGEITPNFALRKVALLFETKKYNECASLLRRLNCVTLGSILHEVPVEVLHDSLPQSLNILEALYVKLYETTETPAEFPKDELQTDQFLLKLVAMFAKQSGLNNKHEKNSNSVYPSCRSILRVITWVEPSIRKFVRMRKKALDKCLRHLGRHGLVESSEGSLMNLHEAFKIELEKILSQYKSAMQKVEELNLSAKHPTGSSVTFGPAPSASSHHRLMQITRDDVQDRIIKNRTLFDMIEPAVSNQYLRKFIHILEKRIEYDKVVLFHDTELRKISKLASGDLLSVSMKEFSQGYATVLQLLKEVQEEDVFTEEDEGEGEVISSDEETISPLMYKDRLRSLSSSFLPTKSGGGSTSRRRQLKGRSFTEGTRPSIIHVGQPWRPGYSSLNGLSNGYLQNGTFPSRLSKVLSTQSVNGGDEKKLEQEIEGLRGQLEKCHEMIKHQQDRERTCLEQISELQSQLGVKSVLGSNPDAVDELVRSYVRLYTVDRDLVLQVLNSLPDLKDVHSLKGKILFSVIVLAFRSAQQYVQELRGRVRHLLNLPPPTSPHVSPNRDAVAMEMEQHIEDYLVKTCKRFDISQCEQEVSAQIFATLYDYPCLKACEGLRIYITSCVSIGWRLSVQSPPFTIVYDSRTFLPDLHTRTETSNPDSSQIQNFLWPSLLRASDQICVHKGIVET